MKRFGWVVAVLTLATAVPAGAQSPAAHATPAGHPAAHANPAAHATSPSSAYSKKIQVNNFSNPGGHSLTPASMSGAGCNSGPMPNRAQTTVNPVNGRSQTGTIVSIPMGKGSGSVASSTTRQQQAEACAHTR